MAQIQQVGQQVGTGSRQRSPLPAHLSIDVGDLAAQDLQQRGLATAVGSLDSEHFPRLEDNIQSSKQPAAIALTGQLSGFKTQTQRALHNQGRGGKSRTDFTPIALPEPDSQRS